MKCPRCRSRCIVQDCGTPLCVACGYAPEETTNDTEERPCLEKNCSAVFWKIGEFQAHQAWHAGLQKTLWELVK